jgi:hypothetical protein
VKLQEKKYRVENFAAVEDRLAILNAEKVGESSSTHYYAPQPDNDVVKIVEHSDHCEIHKLSEANGKFTLTDRISLKDLNEGLGWLRDNDYDEAAVVSMSHTDFAYRGGIVGLYVINDFLRSVILDFPSGQHDAVAQELAIGGAEVIEVPYNKYLEQMGRLELMKVDELNRREPA